MSLTREQVEHCRSQWAAGSTVLNMTFEALVCIADMALASFRDMAVAEAVREATINVCLDEEIMQPLTPSEHATAKACATAIRALDLPALLAGMKEK